MAGNDSLGIIGQVARDSRAQLLSYLAPRAGGDLAGAEDALGDAFVAALEQWPHEGIPEKPEAWLLTVARRRLDDLRRRSEVQRRKADLLIEAMEGARTSAGQGSEFPDERLKLLFVCAHPAIDASARTPLMLQTVIGMAADRIASAFLTSPVAMGQRLVRAKLKIRSAGIPFTIPEPQELPERLGFVLDAIYAAYNAGWQDAEDGFDLAVEAVRLARLVAGLTPEEPEALGLLSLLLHCESRKEARQGPDGEYIPLTVQETSRWNHAMIAEAESLLIRASRHQAPGRFQLEAAIQSVHAQRHRTGTIHWEAIVRIYDGLVGMTASLGARIGRAIALGKWMGPAAGLEALEGIPARAVLEHQPYWAAKARLLSELGRMVEAGAAYAKAIGLCQDPAMRRFLIAQSVKC